METLSAAQARRIALAARGFADPRPGGVPGRRPLRRVLARTGLFQIDSVNVLQRAHYLPPYSRLGPYPPPWRDPVASRRPGELFEYWGHEASLLPMRLHPCLRWRMADGHAWGGVARIVKEQPQLVTWVLGEVRDNGPLTAAEVEADVPRRTGNWGWNWSDAERALEWLFWKGEVLVAYRNGAFARVYDVPDRVLPAEVLNAPTPPPAEAHRELVRVAAGALGVATEADLRDYFRLPVADARQAVRDLVEAGEPVPVRADRLRPAAHLQPHAPLPRWSWAATLGRPFGPGGWRRGRGGSLLGGHHRARGFPS